MSRLATGLAALAALGAGGAMANGIDRGQLDYSILFETGRTLEFSAQQVTPDVHGTYTGLLGGGSTGNMAQSFSSLSFGFKDDINDRLSYAVLIGQPVGADAHYTAGVYSGLEAHWSSEEATALLKYRLGGGTSVFGGLRYVNTAANIVIPSALMGGSGTYTATTANDHKIGYLLGAAYEKPEIALRVGLTYTSAIDHTLDTTETQTFLGTMTSVTDITLPQTLTLDGQTGIAADTLLFGSIRWAQWSKWHVRPHGFAALTTDASHPDGVDIVNFDHDFVTYTLGLGRKLSDRLSVFGALSYEAPEGTVSSRLSPTDGMQSISLGAVWTQDQMKITTGLQYQRLGDTFDQSGTQFSGNHALALGVKMAYSF